jgi:hypothetical protein
MPRGTSELLLLLESDQPIGKKAVAWAVAALVAGNDCPSMRILAGLDLGGHGEPTSFEAAPYVRAALEELEVGQPDLDVVARLYVREVAQAALAGELAPRDAAELVHRLVVTPLNHPDDLMAWCYVWEGNAADCSRPLEEHEMDEEILKVAADFARDA